MPGTGSRAIRGADALRSRRAAVCTAETLPAGATDETPGFRLSACLKPVGQGSSRRLSGLPACDGMKVRGCRKKRRGGRMRPARSGARGLRRGCREASPKPPCWFAHGRRADAGEATRRPGDPATRRPGDPAYYNGKLSRPCQSDNAENADRLNGSRQCDGSRSLQQAHDRLSFQTAKQKP